MTAEEATTRFQRSQQLFDAGQFIEALAELDLLSESFPKERNVLYPKALCLAKTGRIQEALALCDHLVAEFDDARAEDLRASLRAIPGTDSVSFEPIDLGLADTAQPAPYRSPVLVAEPVWRNWRVYAGIGAALLVVMGVYSLVSAGKIQWGASSMQTVSSKPLFESELIFPVDPKHSHGSSIVQCPNGDFLVCWFHGSGERQADDVLVQGARLKKGAKTWSPVFLMADTPGKPDCNPVLFVDPQKTLWLLWITVQDHEWGKSLLKYSTATKYTGDGAPKWDREQVILKAEPVDLEPLMLKNLELVEKNYSALLQQDSRRRGQLVELKKAAADPVARSLGWMTRLRPIMTSDTRMMLGLYSDVFNTSAAAFTEDWGKTWQFSKPIVSPEIGNIQPSFVMKGNGNIVAFMRDNGWPKKIRRAESTDNGVSWSEVTTLDIMNPGSSLECIALKNGHWVLVCNDLPGRYCVRAYLSEDEGATWPYKRALEDFPPDQGSGAYPSVIEAADGSIHATYSYENKAIPGGQTIKHVRFNEAWIREAL